MSLPPFEEPLTLKLGPPGYTTLALALLHLLALVAALLGQVPEPWAPALVLLLLVEARWSLQRVWRQPRRLVRRAAGDWLIETPGGKCQPARLERGLVCLPGLISLSFQTGSGGCTVLISADQLDSEALRKLRLVLLSH